jgi:hypothetical protein
MKKHLREYRPELSRKSVDEIRREMALYRAALRPRQTWWERNIEKPNAWDIVTMVLGAIGFVGGGILAIYLI